MKKRLSEIEKRLKKAKPIEGAMNYPFSGQLIKPRRSLSKHEDDEQRASRHWHCDDVIFICSAYEDIKYLLQEVKKLQKELNEK